MCHKIAWIRIRILFLALDPDPDPDPYIEYTDPQHWKKQKQQSVFRIQIHVDPYRIKMAPLDSDPYWKYGSGTRRAEIGAQK